MVVDRHAAAVPVRRSDRRSADAHRAVGASPAAAASPVAACSRSDRRPAGVRRAGDARPHRHDRRAEDAHYRSGCRAGGDLRTAPGRPDRGDRHRSRRAADGNRRRRRHRRSPAVRHVIRASHRVAPDARIHRAAVGGTIRAHRDRCALRRSRDGCLHPMTIHREAHHFPDRADGGDRHDRDAAAHRATTGLRNWHHNARRLPRARRSRRSSREPAARSVHRDHPSAARGHRGRDVRSEPDGPQSLDGGRRRHRFRGRWTRIGPVRAARKHRRNVRGSRARRRCRSSGLLLPSGLGVSAR